MASKVKTEGATKTSTGILQVGDKSEQFHIENAQHNLNRMDIESTAKKEKRDTTRKPEGQNSFYLVAAIVFLCGAFNANIYVTGTNQFEQH
jgi:hypothetical protein